MLSERSGRLRVDADKPAETRSRSAVPKQSKTHPWNERVARCRMPMWSHGSSRGGSSALCEMENRARPSDGAIPSAAQHGFLAPSHIRLFLSQTVAAAKEPARRGNYASACADGSTSQLIGTVNDCPVKLGPGQALELLSACKAGSDGPMRLGTTSKMVPMTRRQG